MNLNWIDYTILVIITLSVLTGLFRGFVKELIALCVWILAIWLGITYADSLSPWLKPYFEDKTACFIAGFVLVLLASLLAGAIVNAVLGYILRRAGLSGTDRVLGMGFGFIRGVFIVGLIMVVINMTSLSKESYIEQSDLYKRLKPLVGWMTQFMPAVIKKVSFFEKETTNISSLSVLVPDR